MSGARNCKPGDLAILTTSTSGRNAGRLVRVIEPDGTFHYAKYGEQFCWRVEPLTRHYCEAKKQWFEAGADVFARAPDRYLVPLRDQEQALQIEIEAVLA